MWIEAEYLAGLNHVVNFWKLLFSFSTLLTYLKCLDTQV